MGTAIEIIDRPEDVLSPSVVAWLSATAASHEEKRRDVVEWQRTSVPALDEQERVTAIAMLEASCRPLPRSQIVALLSELRQLTKTKKEPGEDIELSFRVYTRELQKWPADVVARVLTTQHKFEKFWPAWQELEERLELYAGKRMRALRMLRGGDEQAR